MNVGIVGLGLIGGSLAKSIKKHSEHTVWGFDIDSDAVTQALMCGAIDETLTDALLPQCDVVLVALYPGACVRYIETHAEAFAPGAWVLDVHRRASDGGAGVFRLPSRDGNAV